MRTDGNRFSPFAHGNRVAQPHPHFNSLKTDISKDSMTTVRGAHSHKASPSLPKENGHAPPSPNFPSAENIPDDTPMSSTSELAQSWVHVAKTFVLIFPIYALGYFEFSFSWLLIGLVLFFCWRRNLAGKNSRLRRALAFFEQEERSAKQSLMTSELPPWVRHSVKYNRWNNIHCRSSLLSSFSEEHVVFL